MARKILLADDSVTAQNMGRKILGDAGYDVVTVNNGSAALKRVAEQKPDLIVLDVYMPGYSGLEVCQRLKDSPETSDIPILLTVGKLEPFKPEEARRVRAEAFIVKPFEASELLAALTRLEDQVVPGTKNGKGEGHGDSETGWKNRIRFPSKKKKEEPEPEPDIDFTAGTANAKNSRRRGSSPELAVEKPLPDIPRDITPEELDALSALAAKLDGQSAVAPPAPVAEKPADPKEFEVPAPEQQAKLAESAAVQQERPAVAPEAESEKVIPAEPSGPVIAEVKPAEVKPAEVKQADEEQPEIVPVNVAELAEKVASPVDQADEPTFATAAAAAPSEEKIEALKVEGREQPSVPVSETAKAEEPAEVAAEAEASEKKEEEKRAEEISISAAASAEIPVEPAKIEAPAPVAAADNSEVTKPQKEVPTPSEEELAEALRLLTPPAAESAAKSAAADHVVAKSWTAVAVAVDPEEASRSLEAEMFKTLAVPEAVNTPAASSSGVKETIAAVMAAAAGVGAAGFAGPSAAQVNLTVEQPVSPSNGPEAKSADISADEAAPATFADAVKHDDGMTVPASVIEQAESKNAALETSVSAAESTTGSEGDMAKEHGKNGKSNWHQIRNAPPAANVSLESAKAEAEEAPEAKAAAAGAGHTPAADAGAIANIVDSVLADLRPKIVEEIAKKLAGK